MTTAVEGPVEAADALWRAIDNIEGWLHPMEAWVLHEEVCQIDRVAPVVVEIGSWKGRSAVALGLAVKRRGAGHVTAIDPQEDPERRSEYYANLDRAGVADVVTTLELLSHDARAQCHPEGRRPVVHRGDHWQHDRRERSPGPRRRFQRTASPRSEAAPLRLLATAVPFGRGAPA